MLFRSESSYSTPLHYAASIGRTTIVELLLGKGASIGARDKFNNTPLYLAAYNGHPVKVELLLEKGASIGAMNECGNTPLHNAALNGHTGTVELLLGKGASIEENEFKQTPLDLAAKSDIVHLLERKNIERFGW